MAVLKSLVHLSSKAAAAALLLLLAVAAVQTQTAKAQSCANVLTNLNVCAPFVVPGATETNPSSECCGALQSVQHDCLCSTLTIASRLPSQCNLPPLNCGN
ncbi:protein MEN-8-like [Durio zibethinus]|uniref:Protein MEN-8-like n=1 Tax=Durio zibethinus TaxID=66656 RepID=A0A6P5Y481_DURZI|nr:protein MEN-8-like [Durio zibethinus]